MGNLLQKMTFSPQQTAPTLRFLLTMTHVDQRCQSSHHQNSLPGPLPWQWHRCHHASATSSESQRQRGQIVVLGWLLFFFWAKNPSGKKRQPLFVYADSQELPTGSLQPPAPLCNDSLGDMGRGRRGGENRGEESVTELLPRSAICPSLSAAGGSS